MDYEFWQELREKHPQISPQSDSSEPIKGKPLPNSHNKREDGKTFEIDADLYPAVPAELKTLHQWVLWKQETRNGKFRSENADKSAPTKIPKQTNSKNAASSNPNTWADYQTVLNHFRADRNPRGTGRDRFSGIGFVFSSSDPYCGIDLDHCLDENRQLNGWAEPIVEKLKTCCYGEVSPSGNGIKFWTKAKLPAGANHKVYLDEPTGQAIEAYDHGRYFTVTGQGTGEIRNGQAIVDWLVTEYLKPQPKSQPAPRAVPTSSHLSPDDLIAKIRQSKQCHKFNALMAGNWTGYGSQSEADLALCGIIAFWTQDPTMIDAIFRQSKLYNRPKWDEPHRGDKATYGQMTIETALSGNRETYNTKSKPKSPTRRRLFRSQQLYGGRR